MSRPGGTIVGAYKALCGLFDFDEGTPWKRLSPAARKAVLYGEGVEDNTLTVVRKKETRTAKREYTYDIEWYGVLSWVEAMYQDAAPGWRKKILSEPGTLG